MEENVLPVGKFSAWLGRVLEQTSMHFSLWEYSIMRNERNGQVHFWSPYRSHWREKKKKATPHTSKVFDAFDNYFMKITIFSPNPQEVFDHLTSSPVGQKSSIIFYVKLQDHGELVKRASWEIEASAGREQVTLVFSSFAPILKSGLHWSFSGIKPMMIWVPCTNSFMQIEKTLLLFICHKLNT